MEFEYTASKTTAIEWLFRRFNKGETNIEDRPRSGRRPSTMIIEILLELLEQQPQTSTARLPADLDSSRSTIPLHHLSKMRLVNRHSLLEVPHKLTVDQQQQQEEGRIDT